MPDGHLVNYPEVIMSQMATGNPLELGYHGRMASERQLCLDPVFGRPQPKLLEATDLGAAHCSSAASG